MIRQVTCFLSAVNVIVLDTMIQKNDNIGTMSLPEAWEKSTSKNGSRNPPPKTAANPQIKNDAIDAFSVAHNYDDI